MVGNFNTPINTQTATSIPAPATTFVLAANGDFLTYLPPISGVSMSGFTFNPAPTPVAAPLWTGGGFSFNLNSVNVSVQNANQLGFIGIGTLSGNYFDPTTGTWTMTIDANGGSFTFSSGTVAVPEPDTVFLLGIVLIGIVGISRKKLKT
jgi:hypothetical protein